MSGTLTLNKVMVDWLTMTSFEDRIYEMGTSLIHALGLDQKESRMQQYAGYLVDGVTGGLWVGTGIQNKQLHNMVRIWGEMAHNSLESVANTFQPYRDNLKRIDAQVTIFEPDGWSQWELLKRLRKNGRTVGWPVPERLEDGSELATVTVGARKESHRFTRIYQKRTDSGRNLLRLEVELKKERAGQHGKFLRSYAAGDVDRLRDELAYVSQQDRKLESAFASALQGWDKPIRVARKETDTGTWIMNQCIPAIDQYLNLHTNDDTATIAYLLAEIVSRHVSANWSDYE